MWNTNVYTTQCTIVHTIGHATITELRLTKFIFKYVFFNVTTILNSYGGQKSFCKYDEFSYCLGKLEHVSMR